MMSYIKAIHYRLRTLSQQAIHHLQVSKGPLIWGIIVLVVAIYFSPHLIPGETNEKLGAYLALSTAPVGVGAFVRARRGAIVTWLLVTVGIILDDLLVYGLAWPLSVINSRFLGILGLLIFALVAGYFRAIGDELARVNAQLKGAYNIIQKQALTDALTGLPNHRAMIDCREKELDRARRFGRPLSVIFFDCDRFKQVNDTYGHPLGDEVLRELGQRINNILRGGDTLGRFGGEEFVVLLPETDAAQGSVVAERMRATIAAMPLAITQVGGGIHATVSIGVATYPEDGRTNSELLSKADQAMYWAKRLGRNQVRSATEIEQISQKLTLTVLMQTEGGRDGAEQKSLDIERIRQSYTLKIIVTTQVPKRPVKVGHGRQPSEQRAWSVLASASSKDNCGCGKTR